MEKRDAEGPPEATRQNRGGRPRLAADEVRSIVLGVSVSARECRAIESLAGAAGMGARPYMRARALGSRTPARTRQECPSFAAFALAEDLAEIGRELREMAAAVEEGRGAEITPDALARLSDAAHAAGLGIIGLPDAP